MDVRVWVYEVHGHISSPHRCVTVDDSSLRTSNIYSRTAVVSSWIKRAISAKRAAHTNNKSQCCCHWNWVNILFAQRSDAVWITFRLPLWNTFPYDMKHLTQTSTQTWKTSNPKTHWVFYPLFLNTSAPIYVIRNWTLYSILTLILIH